MKKNKRNLFNILLISAITIMLISLVGCSGRSYRITFKDYDDTIIKTIKVKEGELPEFGDTPSRESDSFYDYTFFSWDKPLLEASKDETYTAVYVTDVKNDVSEEDIDVNDDTIGEAEKKVEEEQDKQEEPEKVEVLDNQGKPQDTYTVTFYDDDKQTILQKSNYKYGSTPKYKNGLGPSKIVGDYLYVFKSWDKPITVVKSDQFYYAIYDKSKLGADAEERLQVENNPNAVNQDSDNHKSEYTITVSAYKNEWGVVTGSGTYAKGTSVTISATPNEGYIFTKWSDGDSSASRTIVVNSNYEFTAIFEPKIVKTSKKYYVNVISSDPSMGSASITPYRSDNFYNEWEKVNIIASPRAGYKFVKWVFGDSESTAIQRNNLAVTDNVTYVAFFTIDTGESGEDNPGQKDPTDPGEQEKDPVDPGEKEKDPTDPGEQEKDPTNPSEPGENDPTDPSNPGTVDPNSKYKVKVSCNSAHGTVSGGSDDASGNSTLELIATPNEGYVFVKWEDGNTDNPREVTVTGDHEYVAIFALDTFPVKGQIVTFSKEAAYHREYIVINKSGSKLLLLNRDSNKTSNLGFGSLTDTYDTSTLSADCESFYDELSETFKNAIDNTSIDINQYTSYVDAFDELAHASNAIYPGIKTNTIKRNAFALDISEIENYFGNSAMNASTFSSHDLSQLFNLSAGQNTWLRSQNNNTTEYMVTGNSPAKIVYYSKVTTATTTLRPALVADFNKINKSDYSVSDGFLVDGQPKKYTLSITVNDSTKGSVTGAGQYPIGSNVLVKAIPTAGNRFVVWDDGSFSPERLVPITGDVICNAKFSVQGLPSKGDFISIESTEKNGYRKYTVLNITGNIATLLNRDSTYKYPVIGKTIDYASSSLYKACDNFYDNLSNTLKNAIESSTFSTYTYDVPSDDSFFNRSKHASYVNSYQGSPIQNSISSNVYLPDIKDIEAFFGGTSTSNGVFGYNDLKSIFGITSNENIVLRSYVSDTEEQMFAIYGVSGDDVKAISSIDDSFLSSFCIRPIIKVDLSKGIIYSIDGKFTKAPVPSYNIYVESNDETMGIVNSGGKYEDGTKVDLVATPKANYRFAYWSDGSYERERTVTVSGNKTYRAFFSPIEIQSGDLITLNGEKNGYKEYVVLDIKDGIATLLNRDCNLGEINYYMSGSLHPYFDTDMDKLLNEGEFYNNLSDKLKNAIQPTSISLYKYNINDDDYMLYNYIPPRYPAFSTIETKERKVYLPDLSDIEKYFGGSDSDVGFYTADDIKTLFNSGDSSIWLRSQVRKMEESSTYSYAGDDYFGKFVVGIKKGVIRTIQSIAAYDFAEIRPMFKIDLSSYSDYSQNGKMLYKSNTVVERYNIFTSTPNSEFGTTNGGGLFYNGTVHRISAKANDGYKFVRWMDGNTDNPRLITVNDADKEYTAIFDYDLKKGDFITVNGENNTHDDYMVLKTNGSKVYLLSKDLIHIDYFDGSPMTSFDEPIESQLSEYKLGITDNLKNLIIPELFNTYSFKDNNYKHSDAVAISSSSKDIDTISYYELQEFLNRSTNNTSNTNTIFNIPFETGARANYYFVMTRDLDLSSSNIRIYPDNHPFIYGHTYFGHVCPVFWIDLSNVTNYNFSYKLKGNYFDDIDNSYTIKFINDDNSEISKFTLKTGEHIIPPVNLLYKEGYAYNGWNTEVPDFVSNKDLTFKVKWKISVAKGSIIKLNDEKEYRVLSADGSIVKVIAMYDDLTSKYTNTISQEAYSDGTEDFMYEGSLIDTLLNTTWYSSLNNSSETKPMHDAIIQTNLKNYSYRFSHDVPSSGYYCSYEFNWSGTISRYIIDNGYVDVGKRYVYSLDLKDITDYLETINITSNKLNKLFFNQETSIDKQIWLRSLSDGGMNVNGDKAYISVWSDWYSCTFIVRPAFTIDLDYPDVKWSLS